MGEKLFTVSDDQVRADAIECDVHGNFDAIADYSGLVADMAAKNDQVECSERSLVGSSFYFSIAEPSYFS
jgi:hypothetical protein